MKLKEFTVYTSLAGTELLAGCFIAQGLDEYIVYEGRENAEEFLNTSAENWDYADIDSIAPDSEPYIRVYVPEISENEGKIEALRDDIERFCRENPDIDLGSMKITIGEVEEEDWANNWKQYYKPTEIGKRLLVCPSWEKVPEHGARKVLMLDPGMAFGSGLHETTRMCLEALEKNVKEGMSLIDLGCGSGILSIAASLLGAKRMMAVDIDPVCTRVANDNASINGVKLNTVVGNVINDDEFFNSLLYDDESGKQEKYDIVVANIVAGVLIKTVHRIPQLLNKGGIFISSGIIEERLDEVTAEYEKNGLKICDIKHMGEWTCVIAEIG